jgi:hypothetical protein
MTIAATLARRLHETLGEEAADAMVDWMHRVDTGRSELRELNEWNFERFEAKLDARAGELHGRKVDLTRWAIGFWLISLVALEGTLAALARLPR